MPDQKSPPLQFVLLPRVLDQKSQALEIVPGL